MQGGGECVDSVQCANRINSTLGSSGKLNLVWYLVVCGEYCACLLTSCAPPPPALLSFPPLCAEYFPDYINLTYDPSHNNNHKPSAADPSNVFSKWDKFGWWLCDDNPDTNPELYGYHHVWLPYCSGDLWCFFLHVFVCVIACFCVSVSVPCACVCECWSVYLFMCLCVRDA